MKPQSELQSERPEQQCDDVAYRVSPPVSNDELNALFAAAWRNHAERDFQPVIHRSLAFICAYQGPQLVGFVNVAWDGGRHGFVLDTTVHPSRQRCGIGRELLRHAISVARQRELEWLHVDYEPQLRGFYENCGFRPTAAGLLGLQIPACPYNADHG